MPEVTPAVVLLFLATLGVNIGLAARGRWRLSPFFAGYVASNLVSVLPYLWPQRFYTQAFWILLQAVHDVLKIGAVLEIIWRTFRVFPGAASATRHAVLTLLAATMVAAVATPLANRPATAYETTVEDFHPRVMDGTLWVIAAALGLAWFYRIPLHPFHRTVLTTLAIYTAFYSTLLRLFAHHEFGVYRPYADAVNSIVSLVIYSWWAWVVWRPSSAADRAHVRTLQALQFQVPSVG
jgi:hypothetical protein